MRALVQRVSRAAVTVDGERSRRDRPRPARAARRHARRHAEAGRPARRQGARAAGLRRRRRADERAARRPRGPLRLPVHALRRRAQGQPARPTSPPRGPSTPSRSTSASASASAPQRGVFGAHMEVELVNDGPVTLLLELCRRLPRPMPPDDRFVCRFAAEPPQERAADRRWADDAAGRVPRRLPADRHRGRGARRGRRAHAGSPTAPGAGRTYVPVTARTTTGLELFGYVSFVPGDPDDERRRAEPSTSRRRRLHRRDAPSDNPDWQHRPLRGGRSAAGAARAAAARR